jgi:hypothetical protein
VNRGDVRVVQLRRRARLALHARDRLRVRGDGLRKNLDGDRAAEARVFGLPHFAHPARADLGEEPITAE